MADVIKMYEDVDTTKEIETINFGIVEVGDSEQKTVYLKNSVEERIQDIKIEMPKCPNVSIIRAPNNLIQGEVQELIVKWTPPFKLRSALQCPVKITGMRIIDPI